VSGIRRSGQGLLTGSGLQSLYWDRAPRKKWGLRFWELPDSKGFAEVDDAIENKSSQ
jgi:hypothetical protein